LNCLPDRNGGTFDAAGDFDALLGSPNLPVLGSIDPFGGQGVLLLRYRRSAATMTY
jgi:hypothetical protein